MLMPTPTLMAILSRADPRADSHADYHAERHASSLPWAWFRMQYGPVTTRPPPCWHSMPPPRRPSWHTHADRHDQPHADRHGHHPDSVSGRDGMLNGSWLGRHEVGVDVVIADGENERASMRVAA